MRFYPGEAKLFEFDGTSWTTLDTDTGADSTEDTWYDVVVRLDGSHVEVWRATAKAGTAGRRARVATAACRTKQRRAHP